MSIMTVIFLSSEELKELTDLKISKAQIRWLDKNNYPYAISAAGKPKVLRSLLLDRLQNVSTNSHVSEPNFDAIR